MIDLQKYIKTLSILKKKQLLNAVSRRHCSSYSKFIILCHHRTGSTLLHTYLNSHPNVWSRGEDIGQYLRGNIGREKSPDRFLKEDVFGLYNRSIQAVGVKLLYQYRRSAVGYQLINTLCQQSDLKVIHLSRKNLLRVWVSDKIAERTGRYTTWKPTQYIHPNEKKIYVSPDECIRGLNKMHADKIFFEGSFKGCDTMPLTYEDLTIQPMVALAKVQQFLCLKTAKLFSMLLQQNPEPLTQLIVNFEEVKRALAGTRWEQCPDD